MSELRAAMSEEFARYQKWYYWSRFPLVPIIRTRKADRYNTWSFDFHWLAFRFRTLDSVNFAIECGFDLEQIKIRAFLPYCTFGIFIPIAPWGLSDKFWRQPQPEGSAE